MMKFFRKHKKAVSPVIAVMLLVAVAVAAVGAYFIWFRSFQTQTQKSVQEQSSGSLGGGLQMISMTDNSANYFIVLKNTTGSPINVGTTGITASPGGPVTLAANASIASQNSITITATPTFTTVRGTTRTFTINFTVAPGTADARNDVLVYTYTDS